MQHWRRFFPVRKREREQTLTQTLAGTSDTFTRAAEIINANHAESFEALDSSIESYRKNINQQDPAEWLALLILQAPRAAHAQELMDEYPHGYHDREKRLYELIDFNDTLVSTVLALPEAELAQFAAKLKSELDRFCKKVYSRTLSDKQFEAITHGLSREIAVYRAAQHAGLNVAMTSRTADAFGIDMQIQDPESGRYINIDCKTGSAFHFRLKDLVHAHRIAPHDQTDAETKGWWEIVNRGDGQHIRIILLRISQEDMGEIHDFTFVDDREIIRQLRAVLHQRSLSDGQFGKIFTSL